MTSNPGTIAANLPGSGEKLPFARRFRWSNLLWQLVYPRGGPRTAPTASGLILIFLSMGIGSAAYNSANNILFITLSLLLACLILSGVLSWLNFRRVNWRFQFNPPFRAGQETGISIGMTNSKEFVPTYGLWFDVSSGAPPGATAPLPGEKKPDRLRPSQRIAAVGRGRVRERLFQRGRLEPGGEARLDWSFKPARRGVQRLSLDGVGSLFPFGFLKKSMGGGLSCEVIVWPAPLEYRTRGTAGGMPQMAGERTVRAGGGSDLLALRKYQSGDSHRLIHWKASARMRQWLVRQFAAEGQDAYTLWLTTPAEVWIRPEQFELLVSFAATLAEDLFRAGKLRSVALNGGSPRFTGRVRDVESFLDELAVVRAEAGDARGPGGAGTAGRNLLTFEPDGPHGVAAVVDGRRIAST